MSSYAWHGSIKTVKGCRSKSFPPDRLSPFPKGRFFILRNSLSGGGVGWGWGKDEIKCLFNYGPFSICFTGSSGKPVAILHSSLRTCSHHGFPFYNPVRF